MNRGLRIFFLIVIFFITFLNVTAQNRKVLRSSNQTLSFKIDSLTKDLLQLQYQNSKEVDSLNNLITTERALLKSQRNNNKLILNRNDSLAFQIQQVKDSLEVLNKKLSISKNDTANLFKSCLPINYRVDENRKAYTHIYPIGWSEDDNFFAYFAECGDVAYFLDFNIDKIDNTGKTNNVVSFPISDGDYEIDSVLKLYNSLFQKTISAFKISKNSSDTLLKTDNDLQKEKGWKIIAKETVNGECESRMVMISKPRITAVEFLMQNGDTVISQNNLFLENVCCTDIQNLGYLESPNKKHLLFFIANWGVNYFEGFVDVGVSLISFPGKSK